jgi:hypothetical protein
MDHHQYSTRSSTRDGVDGSQTSSGLAACSEIWPSRRLQIDLPCSSLPCSLSARFSLAATNASHSATVTLPCRDDVLTCPIMLTIMPRGQPHSHKSGTNWPPPGKRWGNSPVSRGLDQGHRIEFRNCMLRAQCHGLVPYWRMDQGRSTCADL